MEKVTLVVFAGFFILYFLVTETLDWVGRIEVIHAHFPSLPQFLERRMFRVILLLVAIGLLIRVATEGHDNKVARVESQPSQTSTQTASPITEKPNQSMEPTQPLPTPQVKKAAPSHKRKANKRGSSNIQITGNENVAGNTVTGNNNVVGNGNQVFYGTDAALKVKIDDLIKSLGTPPERAINNEQAKTLIGVLQTASHNPTIRLKVVGSSDPEVDVFSRQIEAVLGIAKWQAAVERIGQEISTIVSDHVASFPKTGTHCAGNKDDPSFQILQHGLASIGRDCIVDEGENSLWLSTPLGRNQSVPPIGLLIGPQK